jgi:hypothetical protein
MNSDSIYISLGLLSSINSRHRNNYVKSIDLDRGSGRLDLDPNLNSTFNSTVTGRMHSSEPEIMTFNPAF